MTKTLINRRLHDKNRLIEKRNQPGIRHRFNSLALNSVRDNNDCILTSEEIKMKNADMPSIPCKVEMKLYSPRGSGYASSTIVECSGLTKRETFAMHALNSVLIHYNYYDQGDFDSSNYKETAKHAVGLADALLKELDN